jgi:uncharacterized protein YndB with AHSA1/START domain
VKQTILAVVLGLLIGVLPATSASVDPIVTEGILNAPVEEVWKVWTTKEGIESWMVAKTDIDLRVGATWRTSYSKASNLDDDTAIHQAILAFDPGRMFSFRTVKWPKNFPFPNAISGAWTVVYFERVTQARTRITVRMMGFTEDAESQRMRAFFESGNKMTLDNLVKRFEK